MITKTRKLIDSIQSLTALAHYGYRKKPAYAEIEIALARANLLIAAQDLEPTPAQDKELKDWAESALLFERFAAGEPLGGLFETDAPQRKAYAAIASAYRALIAAAERSPAHG